MDKTLNLEIIKRLVEIDKHTDYIKDNMSGIVRYQASIASEMREIGKLYLDVLVMLKKDSEL